MSSTGITEVARKSAYINADTALNRKIDKIDVLKWIALRLYLFIISLVAVKNICVLSDIATYVEIFSTPCHPVKLSNHLC